MWVSAVCGCLGYPETFQVAGGNINRLRPFLQSKKTELCSSPGDICTTYISEHVPPSTAPTHTAEITGGLRTAAFHWDKTLIPCSPKTLSGNGWKPPQLSYETGSFYSQWREISISTAWFIWVILEIHLEMGWIVPKKCLFLQSDKREKLDDYLRCKYLSCRDLKCYMINTTFTV